MTALLPKAGAFSEQTIADMDVAKDIIAGIRTVRLQKNIPNKEELELQVMGEGNVPVESIIKKLANLSAVANVSEKMPLQRRLW